MSLEVEDQPIYGVSLNESMFVVIFRFFNFRMSLFFLIPNGRSFQTNPKANRIPRILRKQVTIALSHPVQAFILRTNK
jgi:hypothetical protein